MRKRGNGYISVAIGSQPKESDTVKLGIESEGYRGVGKRGAKPGMSLVGAAAGNGANRESEPTVVLSQQLGGTSVESSEASGKTGSSTHLGDSDTSRELTDHEKKEGHF